MPDSAPERQSTNTGGRNDPTGSGESENMVGMIHISPGASAPNGNGARSWIDPRVFDASQVDDQPVVADPKPTRVVPAAPNGKENAIFPGEIDAMDHIRHVHAAHDEPRLLVDHAIINLASVVISFIAPLDHSPS